MLSLAVAESEVIDTVVVSRERRTRITVVEVLISKCAGSNIAYKTKDVGEQQVPNKKLYHTRLSVYILESITQRKNYQ